jgi:hypothetical protein
MATLEAVSKDRHTTADVFEQTDELGAYAECKRPGCLWKTDPDEGFSFEDVCQWTKQHVDEPHGAFR